MEKVILVDKTDHQIGEMEKQEAHIKGLLHRAFSIFIFNSKGEVLLQQRAHFINIIQEGYGQTLVVVTQETERQQFKQPIED